MELAIVSSDEIGLVLKNDSVGLTDFENSATLANVKFLLVVNEGKAIG